jgi:hypothetical protein
MTNNTAAATKLNSTTIGYRYGAESSRIVPRMLTRSHALVALSPFAEAPLTAPFLPPSNPPLGPKSSSSMPKAEIGDLVVLVGLSVNTGNAVPFAPVRLPLAAAQFQQKKFVMIQIKTLFTILVKHI